MAEVPAVAAGWKGIAREQETDTSTCARKEQAQAEKEDGTDDHPVRRFGARADSVHRTERLRGMTSRTPNLPGGETQRGNEHVGKAVK